jgi:hypothetical protein
MSTVLSAIEELHSDFVGANGQDKGIIAVVDLSMSTLPIRREIIEAIPDDVTTVVVFAEHSKIVTERNFDRNFNPRHGIGWTTNTADALKTALHTALQCHQMFGGGLKGFILHLITDGAADKVDPEDWKNLDKQFTRARGMLREKGCELGIDITVIPCNSGQNDVMHDLLCKETEENDVHKLPGIEFIQLMIQNSPTSQIFDCLCNVKYQLASGDINMELGNEHVLFGLDWGQDLSGIPSSILRKMIELFRSSADRGLADTVAALGMLRELEPIVYRTEDEPLVVFWKETEDCLFMQLSIREKMRFIRPRADHKVKVTTLEDALLATRAQKVRKLSFEQNAAILKQASVFLTDGAVYLLVALLEERLSFITVGSVALNEWDVDIKTGKVDTGSGVYKVAFQTFFGKELDHLTETSRADLHRMQWRDAMAEVCGVAVQSTRDSVLAYSADLKWLPMRILACATLVPETRDTLVEVLLWMIDAQEVRDGSAYMSTADSIRVGRPVSEESSAWMVCDNPQGKDAVKVLVLQGIAAFSMHKFFDNIVCYKETVDIGEDLCYTCLDVLRQGSTVTKILCDGEETNLLLCAPCCTQTVLRMCPHPIHRGPMTQEDMRTTQNYRSSGITGPETLRRSQMTLQEQPTIDTLFNNTPPGGHLATVQAAADAKEQVRCANIQIEANRVAQVRATKNVWREKNRCPTQQGNARNEWMRKATSVQISNTLHTEAAEARAEILRTCFTCDHVCKNRGELWAHLKNSKMSCKAVPNPDQANMVEAALRAEAVVKAAALQAKEDARAARQAKEDARAALQASQGAQAENTTEPAARSRDTVLRTCFNCNLECTTRTELFAHLNSVPTCKVLPNPEQAERLRVALLAENGEEPAEEEV